MQSLYGLADQIEIDFALFGPVFLGDDAGGILDLQQVMYIHAATAFRKSLGTIR